MIKIEKGNLFFKDYHALQDINLKIEDGERIAIVGSNGSGKSTLIDVITGIKKLKNGKVTLTKKAKKMGVQFQSKDFPFGLKTIDLISFYLDIYNLNLKDDYVQDLINKFKLDSKLNVTIKKMSGGQQQKLNILIALLNKPNLLIMDELVTALDITSQKEIIDIVSKFVKSHKEMTLILVSHNEAEIKELASRIIKLNDGKIINDDSKAHITKKYGSIDNYFKNMDGDNE